MPAKIPYPPSPVDIPEGLTDHADSFTRKQSQLLAGLFVFLILYIAAVIFCAMVGVWCFLTFAKYPAVKVIGMVLCGTFFLYLVKGFFKRPAMDKEMHIEITEEEQPVLFDFIHQLCEELGAPEPSKVYVAPDVNAACMSRTSLVNLFVEPKRDLLIGLGLVNCMNLSEFKAVLAHEFGHFCHLGPTNSYAYVVKRIIFDLVEGEDWFDRLINWCKRQDNAVSVFGYAVGGCLWVPRKVLWWILNAITLQSRALSREQEFHADLVAVSAAGSDASTHGLLRARFGMQCFMQAVDDLSAALDHKLYSNDLYVHQDRAAAVVRRKKKEPELGLPPAVAHPTAGKDIKVFDAEQDELEDEDDTPPMWRTHPADADREENVKEQFVVAATDHRSPWILFKDAADLKERMSYKFYRMVFHIPKNSDLTDAQRVQEFIDNEHVETTYDPKYHGAYDDRPLEPGELSELDAIIQTSPWTDDRMEKVYDKLFDGCREHAEAHSDLHKELNSLKANQVGKPSPKIKRMIKEAEAKNDANWEWFKSFDRRVYLLHVQMAAQVNREWKQELVERYRFQMTVQKFFQEARENFNESDRYICAYGAASRGEIQVPDDFGAEVIAVLRAAWKALKNIVQEARETNLPAMKNFEEGERLADFILEGKMVPEPPLSELKGTWVSKLMTQLQGVKNRCFRLHFKSVGGILALQEKIAAAWVESRAPVPAEIVDPETILAAEVIPAEVVVEGFVDEPMGGPIIAAEVIPAEVQVESFVEALPVDDIEEPPPLISEPAGAAMAAFVTTPSHQHAPPPVPPVSAGPMPAKVEPVFVAEVVPDPPPAPAHGPVKEPVFSLDLDSASAPAPAPAVSKPAEPATAPVEVKADLPPVDVFQFDATESPTREESVFSLNAAASPKTPFGKAAAPQPVPAEEVFSLDADGIPSAEVVPAEEIISLDADAIVAEPVEPAPARPAFGANPPAGKKPTSGTGTSASMPALASSNGVAKPVIRKRPALKITIVKPGEKSPFEN